MTGIRPIVIALDGPAASGKSSTAQAVAAELGFRYLDSGAFYRTITLAALDQGIPAEEWPDLSRELLNDLSVGSEPSGSGYTLSIDGVPVGDRIRAPEVNAHVARMAAVPAVRHWLLEALREAGRDGGLVADGRDIGTVVFPDAELKVFLVCDPEERALRRLRQQGQADPDQAAIRAEAGRLVERDRQDESREAAPLLRAPDAVMLDTTGLSFDAQVRAITRLAHARAGA
ncbi:MAG: (d)CMP kinase, partial [Gemmatimonadota bacterium]